MTEEIFRLEQDDKSYIVTVENLGSKIRYTCQCENDPSDTDIYTNEVSLTDFRGLTSSFRIFNSIGEVKDNLAIALDPNNPQIGVDKEGKNCVLIFYTQTGTDDDFARITLYPQKSNQNIETTTFSVRPQPQPYNPPAQQFQYQYQPPPQRINNTELERQVKELTLRNTQLAKEISDLKKQTESQRKYEQEQKERQRLEGQRQRQLQKQKEIELQKQRQLEREKNELLRISQTTQPLRAAPGGGSRTLQRGNITISRPMESSVIQGEIIRNSPELELISRRINSNGQNINFDLLYKATADGGDARSFHSKCDMAAHSLVLVETTDGRRFGGFTSQSWEGDCEDKTDDKAFIFSLDKMMAYDVKNGEPAIGCYPEYGPVFMGCQIRIFDDCFNNGGTTFERDLNYNTTEDYELTGGKKNFQIKEIEVYGVTFG